MNTVNEQNPSNSGVSIAGASTESGANEYVPTIIKLKRMLDLKPEVSESVYSVTPKDVMKERSTQRRPMKAGRSPLRSAACDDGRVPHQEKHR